MSPLVLAIPSKGRLQENAMAFFARAGLALTQDRGGRGYRGSIPSLGGVEVRFLSASEIARELAAGTVHVGVTGEDLVRESLPNADRHVAMVEPLGFGHANVVVAVPDAWIDVSRMADLDEIGAGFAARVGHPLRVATKYRRLTREFFAGKGVLDYRIVDRQGATAGAPAAGTAEIVVDITTTGATLAANGLKVLEDGVILESQANLVASRNASWTPDVLEALRRMLDRIAGEARAGRVREVRFQASDVERLAREAAARFGATAPFGAAGDTGVLHVDTASVFDLAAFLRARGAGTITVARLAYVFEDNADAWRRVESALTG